jgi:ATP-dependent DNA ligase
MPFISPMLAAPMPNDWNGLFAGNYIAEEKFDGLRLIAEVLAEGSLDLFSEGKTIRAWSRYGNTRPLPEHILRELKQLPVGVYDGELFVPGKRSYGATEIANTAALELVLFDVLELRGESTVDVIYQQRRSLLELAHKHIVIPAAVSVSEIFGVVSREQITEVCQTIWSHDGEGLILKQLSSIYQPGKRPKAAFIKLKALRSAVMVVTGFEAGKLGPHAKVSLTGDDGVTTTVKTKNNEWLRKLEVSAADYIGRRLRIEYQERTPDGSYRHPRWDRWAEEDE